MPEGTKGGVGGWAVVLLKVAVQCRVQPSRVERGSGKTSTAGELSNPRDLRSTLVDVGRGAVGDRRSTDGWEASFWRRHQIRLGRVEKRDAGITREG